MTSLKKQFACSIFIFIFIFGASPIFAGWTWLDKSPAGKFNEKDWNMLKSATNELLDNGTDGDMREWSNEESGNSGKIKIISSSESDGKRCRKVAFLNIAGNYGLSSRSVQIMCKQPDGKWKVEP
ncbi:MAG TPA: RT0821/Lpp0805 family surface protein [Gammaproteobacteria bacterium]